MKNVEKLKSIGQLHVLRRRLGADDDNDETYDDEINALTNDQIVREWSKWYLGSSDWWISMKDIFDNLEKL